MWVVEYFNKVFKNTGKDIKILVTGDSAGGNLSAALTGLAIKLGIKIPDALLLIYPALNLSVKRVTPSQFTSVDDFLLPLSVLQICREAYID
jgi:hormone-sensitive lipase